MLHTTVVHKKAYLTYFMEKKLQGMLHVQVTQPSSSTFALPVTVARKEEDRSLGPCMDNRRINEQTELFSYPMSHVDDIIQELGRCNQFLCMNSKKACRQASLLEVYKKCTALLTTFNVYKYNRLWFGWKNLGAWFLKIMDDIL